MDLVATQGKETGSVIQHKKSDFTDCFNVLTRLSAVCLCSRTRSVFSYTLRDLSLIILIQNNLVSGFILSENRSIRIHALGNIYNYEYRKIFTLP